MSDLIPKAALYISGLHEIKLRGDHNKVLVAASVIKESRILYELLYDKDIDMNNLTDILSKKRAAAIRFKRVFGITWPL